LVISKSKYRFNYVDSLPMTPYHHGKAIDTIISLLWLLSSMKQAFAHTCLYCSKNEIAISGVISMSK